MALRNVNTWISICMNLVVGSCIAHNVCSRLLSVLDDRSERISDYHWSGIKFDHAYLDVSKGYVPHVQYSVIITNPPLIPIQELILMSVSLRRTKRESIGTFHLEKTPFTFLKCRPAEQDVGEVEMLSAIATSGNSLEFPMTIEWTAPRDTSPDCALFKIAFGGAKNASNWTMIRERLCRNRGIYHFISGSHGTEEFSWQGPTTRTVIVEAPRSSSVYAQIMRASYSGPSSKAACPGATIRVTTDAVERNFSAQSRRFCVSDSVSSPTTVFRSTTGVIILEFAIVSSGHLSFELAHYNLLGDKGCNISVSHRKTGTIQSPNYPSDYFGSMDCYYSIQVEREERIVGRFIELQLNQAAASNSVPWAGQDSCTQGDFIQMTTGSQSTTWCGTKSVNDTVFEFQSADNAITMHFHSDPRQSSQSRSNHRYFFKILWRAYPSCQSSQKYTGMRGRITSVNYPNAYLNSQQCMYIIEVPSGFVVQLRFRDFRLQPTDRYVANCQNPPFVHDYIKVGDRKFCGNWTGRETEGLVFRSATNLMNFTFVSDELTAFNGGFSAEYRAVTPNETQECRPGQSFFDGLCYDVRDYKADWETALRGCQYGGGILAIINSASIQRFLNRLLMSIDGSEDHAYWVGAHDLRYESDFTWITGKKVDYSNWFHGWPAFDNYNKQPNDDGLSQQNCLELRRKFSHPSKGFGYAEEFFWSDRECHARNGFICQYARIGAPSTTFASAPPQSLCNETITLTASSWRASVSSPNYPQVYTDFADCYIIVEPPTPGHVLILDFNKFVLEDHPNCEYDYLEIWEETVMNGTHGIVHSVTNADKICGDKSEELKLLRRTVLERRVVMHFSTDHSRVFMGFQLTVYIDDTALTRTLNLCNDKNWFHFDNQCYLIVYYPTVDWKTAREICSSSGHVLALPESSEEETYLVEEVLKSSDYKVGDSLWLGAKRPALADSWKLENGQQRFNYTDWYPKVLSLDDVFSQWQLARDVCLTLQQHFPGSTSTAPINTNRPFWGHRFCDGLAGYICKGPRPLITEGQKLNDTFFLNGSGVLTLPSHPSPYPNFFEYVARLVSDENTRILIVFDKVDVEYQRHCLYDYIHLRTFEDDLPVNICGTITDRKPNFASYSNQALLRFHSDSSVTGQGFVATWQVINISDCYMETDRSHGYINSVNFPDFYLNALDCTATIRAPIGSRILLDFVYFDVGTRPEQESYPFTCHNTDYVSVFLDGDYSTQYVRICGRLNLAHASRGMTYVSTGNVLRVAFHSDATVWGDGYRAKFDIIYHDSVLQDIYPNDTHTILSPNYPFPFPPDLCLQQIYRVPYGYQLIVEVRELELDYFRLDGDSLFIREYIQEGYVPKSQNISMTTHWNRFILDVCSNKSTDSARRYRAVLNAVEDPLFWRNKTVSNYTGLIESCQPDPCRNGGTCELGPEGYYCRCKLSYLGAFCHVSPCDLHPCVYGTCVVTSTPDKYRCDCQLGYEGKFCDEEIHRCASNPCQHGTCIEGLDSYTCICIDGYKGENCQKADLLNAMTLRESFLRDPFWLGLFLVLGVISIVGITRCFRKRFKYTGFTRVQEEEEAIRRKETIEPESEDEQGAAIFNSCLQAAEGLEVEECREDGEVYFTLKDLGVGPSHYRNLGHFEKVSFKLKLSDLSEQELDTLEAYLEHIAATMEGAANEEGEQQDQEGSSSTPPGQRPCPRLLKSTPFATALESVTSIILKSAEIVDKDQVQEELQHRRALRASNQPTRRASMSARQSQVLRGAARRAFEMVRRPRSIELAEIKSRVPLKSVRGTSYSLGHISPMLIEEGSNI